MEQNILNPNSLDNRTEIESMSIEELKYQQDNSHIKYFNRWSWLIGLKLKGVLK